MGFYGNISNATRTQFTFDRIYPSRKAMEDAQAVDGVYVGRYVLVEYDSDVHTDYYERVYKVDGKLYRSNTNDVKTELTVSNTVNTQIVRVEPDNYPDNVAGTTEFYLLKHVNGQLRFELIAGNDSNYSSNYNVDLRAFYGEGGGRGYDSTVWQKVYTEGIEKYVMVAELNTVVPTFDITADAPTMAPRLPHFDADSTNVYYKVHWQPQWGVRVKGAQSYQTPQLNDDGSQRVSAGEGTPLTVNSSDDIIYPSDYSTEWTRHEYKRDTGEAPIYYATVDEANNLDWEENTGYSEVPAAVYFNKAGFSPDKITYSSHYDTDNKTTTTYKDYNNISIAPTGRSGHRYSTHQNGAEHECDIDIQEMSIMLPGIGDTIAKLWDMVYGDEIVNHGRNRNKNIQWNSVDGIRMVSTNHGYDANGNLINTNGFTYNKNGHISTIAGCINSVHDLMGMIIQDPSKEDFEKYQNDASSLADNLIYYYQGAYYRKKKIFNFNKLEHNNYIFREIPIGEDNYQSNTYYCLVGGKYVEDLGMEYDSNKVYYERIIDATGSYDPVEFTYEYAPNIWYTKGHNDTYTLATEECINPDEIYYTITPTKIEISNDYVTDTYFRPSEGTRVHEYEYRKGYEKELDAEGNKVPIMEKLSDTHTIRDFNLSRTPQATPGESYYRLTFKEIDITEGGAKLIYEPGKFFYDPTPEDAIGQYKLSNDLHPVEGRQYLYGEVGDSSTKEYTTWDEETQSYITITEEIYEFITPPYPVEVVDIANYKTPKQEIDAEGNPIFNEDGSPKYIMEGDKPKLFNIHIYISEPVDLTEEEISAGITEPPVDLLNWKQLTYNPTDYTGPYYCIDENERIDSFYSYGQFWYVNKSELDESNPDKNIYVDVQFGFVEQ